MVTIADIQLADDGSQVLDGEGDPIELNPINLKIDNNYNSKINEYEDGFLALTFSGSVGMINFKYNINSTQEEIIGNDLYLLLKESYTNRIYIERTEGTTHSVCIKGNKRSIKGLMNDLEKTNVNKRTVFFTNFSNEDLTATPPINTLHKDYADLNNVTFKINKTSSITRDEIDQDFLNKKSMGKFKGLNFKFESIEDEYETIVALYHTSDSTPTIESSLQKNVDLTITDQIDKNKIDVLVGYIKVKFPNAFNNEGSNILQDDLTRIIVSDIKDSYTKIETIYNNNLPSNKYELGQSSGTQGTNNTHMIDLSNAKIEVSNIDPDAANSIAEDIVNKQKLENICSIISGKQQGDVIISKLKDNYNNINSIFHVTESFLFNFKNPSNSSMPSYKFLYSFYLKEQEK
jgi:hypothetical protein